ncbi:hypothetical protein Mal64_39200 [Pseudobythopirellula maris]|uniref:Zinc-ribbon domain-containing protein n=1 Tax=Pseudobythopirellula maris TaxID=2527991 RepID=A0A5C5ZGD0_9BACT|nr:zinc ribbon domain-containing protein [Pseudobythopirellula maris]TWT86180.1 hypothetical protein Mal64_39200 [Pseudobythopirellula maris]
MSTASSNAFDPTIKLTAVAPVFCSHCGRRGENRFCSACGAPLKSPEAGETPAAPAPVGDWRQETRLERLLAHAEVRERIERAQAGAKPTVSGEQVLGLLGAALPGGVPYDKLAGVVQPMYASMGVKLDREQRGEVAAPVGETIVRALCSLGRRGQELRGADQADDGVTLIATLPSDVWALGGEIRVAIRGRERTTLVEAATHIPGQWLDWGKSRKGLERLFGDLRAAA